MKGIIVDENGSKKLIYLINSFNPYNNLMKSVIIALLILQLRKSKLRDVKITRPLGREHMCSAVYKRGGG